MRVRVPLLAVLALALFPVTAWANYPHVVTPGETLTSVAATDGLSVQAIAATNGISPETELVAGKILWIPPRTAINAAVQHATTESSTAASTAAQSSTQARSKAQSDTDDLSDTAEGEDTSFHSSTSSTSSASTSSASTSSVSTGSTSTSSAPTSSTAASGSTPEPTAERVSGGEIAQIAAQYGVPASLAEAIGWQESGWNNAEVSGIGAVGVMQIVPGTWDWIDRYLTPSSPLGTASAAENVRAGVLLLHQLLGLTGGNESLAAAGYYQGLSSVEAHGMYPDTRRYVADVMALAQRL